MSYTIALIQQNNLQQADAIVLRKKLLGMVDHFALFMGYDTITYEPVFIANYTKGIKKIEQHELNQFLTLLEPTRIERFEGTEQERQEAVKRGMSRIDEDAYHLLKNNCESFKNYVQKGINYSKQVQKINNISASVAAVAAMTGLSALTAKNKKVAAWALGISAIASIAYAISKNDD